MPWGIRRHIFGLGYLLCAMRTPQKQRRRRQQWRGRSVILPLLLMSNSFTCEAGSAGLRNHETTPEGGHVGTSEIVGPLDQGMPGADEFTGARREEPELLSSGFPGENDHPVTRLSATIEHSLLPEVERRNLGTKGKEKPKRGKKGKAKNKKAQKKKAQKKKGKSRLKPQMAMKAKKSGKTCNANAQRQCCKRASEANFFTFCSNRGCNATRCPQYMNSPMVQWAAANGVEMPGGESKGCERCSAKPYNAAAFYSAHEKVEAGCEIYKCKDAPFDRWCSNPAYAPSTEVGRAAWALVKSC